MKTDELRALLAKATPGEWRIDESERERILIAPADVEEYVAVMFWNNCDALHDAKLVVAMRNELPALLDRLDAAEKDAARYRFLRDSGSASYVVSGPGGRDYEGAALDAAIDHATASERGGCDG